MITKFMKSKNLTEEQKQEFIEIFYSISENPLNEEDDISSPHPWGCPWEWTNRPLKGFTIEEMANNFFNDCKKCIIECLEEEKSV